MTTRFERRRFLVGVGGAFGALAGCTDSDGDGNAADPSPNGGTGTPTGGSSGPGDTDAPDGTTQRSTTTEGDRATPTDGGTTMTGTTENEDDIDLREANVVEVSIDRGTGDVRFDVTLYHDDDGEAAYANWWQVETLDGDRLGRRELRHAHSTAPFTRSKTIEVPDDVTCVVVRGHDQTHGYGGQVALVNHQSGGTAFVQQGSERQSFDAGDCP